MINIAAFWMEVELFLRIVRFQGCFQANSAAPAANAEDKIHTFITKSHSAPNIRSTHDDYTGA